MSTVCSRCIYLLNELRNQLADLHSTFIFSCKQKRFLGWKIDLILFSEILCIQQKHFLLVCICFVTFWIRLITEKIFKQIILNNDLTLCKNYNFLNIGPKLNQHIGSKFIGIVIYNR